MKKTQEELLENQDIEIRLLIEAIHQKYGYDFRNYSQAHIKRRILNRFHASGLKNISGEVIPVLQTYPYIKIWHAGCSSGEEVYSMAILLREAGILQKCQIYATDFNPVIIRQAREGIYPISRIREFTVSYQKSGGTGSFSDYYTANYESAKLLDTLKKNIVFATHNLVTDSVFAEVNMVVCRNVLIYFDRTLQDKVIGLFSESLPGGGILALGSKENLQFSAHYHHFNPVVPEEKIYMKKYTP